MSLVELIILQNKVQGMDIPIGDKFLVLKEIDSAIEGPRWEHLHDLKFKRGIPEKSRP